MARRLGELGKRSFVLKRVRSLPLPRPYGQRRGRAYRCPEMAGEQEASGREILRRLLVVLCFLAAGVGGAFIGAVIADATCNKSDEYFRIIGVHFEASRLADFAVHECLSAATAGVRSRRWWRPRKAGARRRI
jgi:hypothetical protein